MEKHRIFLASFAGVYPHYIQKAEKNLGSMVENFEF